MERKESWISNIYIRLNRFKKKTVIKDKEEHCIMRNGSIQQMIQHLYMYMHPSEDQDIQKKY